MLREEEVRKAVQGQENRKEQNGQELARKGAEGEKRRSKENQSCINGGREEGCTWSREWGGASTRANKRRT